jgi:hypothetical protein
MADTIPKGTAGFKLIFDYGTSLSAATTNQILYTTPSGTDGSWTATVSGTTIEYTVISTDFDEVGNWSYQGYVVTPAFTQPSTVKNIEVTEFLG